MLESVIFFAPHFVFSFRRTLDCGDSRRRLSYRHRVAGQLGNRSGRRTGEISNAVPHCIVVATVANTLGGMTSYGIGRFLPAKPEKSKALTWLHRYGEWMLLMSWVPLFGDALCVAAGWLRINPWLTLLMLAIGKCARYLAIAGGWAWVAAKWFA